MSVLFGRQEVTSRGQWLAIIAASMLLQLPYWIATFAFAASHEGQEVPAVPVLFALGFVPLVFLILSFGSRNPRAPGATLKAMGLFVLVGALVALVNPVVGLVAGFGAGGIVALRPAGSSRRPRVIALLVGCLYLYVLLAVLGVGVFAIVTGAALPFGVLGIADEVTMGRAQQGARRDRDATSSSEHTASERSSSG